MKHFITSLICLMVLSSCSVKRGYIKFSNTEDDEVVSSSAIKQHLKENPNPSIVLKAPEVGDRATESDDNAYIYNTIEKELLIAGFDVKDRGLFNEVVSKSKEVDYSEIKKITGTDLILELVQLDPAMVYKTNKFYTEDDKEMIEPGVIFEKYGAVIEFKITIIEGNKHGGSYLFYYTPCLEKTSDCNCEVAYKSMPQSVYLRQSFCNSSVANNEAFESIPRDYLSDFVRNGVRKMLSAIRS